MMKKGDIILLLVLVFGMSVAFIVNNGNSAQSVSIWSNSNKTQPGELIAVIKKDNEILRTINLSRLKERETIDIDGQYRQTIIIDKHGLCFSESSCPDKECLKSKWITKPGQMLMCLPNRTIVKILDKNEKIVDGKIK